jgi:hypothetical protein
LTDSKRLQKGRKKLVRRSQWRRRTKKKENEERETELKKERERGKVG